MVFYERAEKVLAFADYSLSCPAGKLGGLHIGFGSCAFHLHAFLSSRARLSLFAAAITAYGEIPHEV